MHCDRIVRSLVCVCFLVWISNVPARAQLMEWFQGPYWRATYSVTGCEHTALPPGYVFYLIGPCDISFPLKDADLSFYFSDSRPGLMLFESVQVSGVAAREVRNLTFNSHSGGFSFARRGDYAIETLWIPNGGPFTPTTLRLSGNLTYTFAVTSRTETTLAGTFVATRPFIAHYADAILPEFDEAHIPVRGTGTATGTWSAQVVSALPSPRMNGYDFCDYHNIAYFYDVPPGGHPFHCNPDDATSFCGSYTNACVYDMPTEGNELALLNATTPAVVSGAFDSIGLVNILEAGRAYAFSADGVSAAVVAVKTKSPNPVTIAVTSTAAIPSYPTLSTFSSGFVKNPTPGGASELQIPPSDCVNYDGQSYICRALLWPPEWPDKTHGNALVDSLKVTADQDGTAQVSAQITLQPPPVLLVHGVWSSAAQAGFADNGGLKEWLLQHYPHKLIGAANYGGKNDEGKEGSALAYDDPRIQDQYRLALKKLLSGAGAAGTVARQVDIVGHSMGGLVTRYFLNKEAQAPGTYFPPAVVHRLIAIGTPHLGSPLASKFMESKQLVPRTDDTIAALICRNRDVATADCTLGKMFSLLDKDVDSGGVESLTPSYPATLSQLALPPRYHAIAGQAPLGSLTEGVLNGLIASYRTDTIHSLIGGDQHDTIVPQSSQLAVPGVENQTTYNSIVHTALVPLDTGETASRDIWAKTYFELTGQVASAASARPSSKAERAIDPFFDLTGYTEVDTSHVGLSPSSGTALAVGAPASITATSATKTIVEVLIFQTGIGDGAMLLFATSAPFTIQYTPAKLGTVAFVAVAVFSDMTYATTLLNYPISPPGPVLSLTIDTADETNLERGMTIHLGVTAEYPSGPLDVSNVATYAVRSGTPAVFTVDQAGQITALHNGIDWLDVTFGGSSASARIIVRSTLEGVLNADGNDSYDALTDGLLILRYLFGLTGPALTNGAIGTGATRTDPAAILGQLDNARSQLDIDGNGQADALTDGLLLIRYLFGLRGVPLVSGAIGANATRTTAEQIESYIQSLMP